MYKAKRLTTVMIESSSEIQQWLDQFNDADKHTAISLLSRLQFISRDTYSAWLKTKLADYINQTPCAIYAVRKFSKNAKHFWKPNGSVQPRPATTQGSEDLVSSVIAELKRKNKESFLDHPSLYLLKKEKVHKIILVEDSIGSGTRVANFICLMMNSKTFRSWWSGGFIKLHILSLVRSLQSERYILRKVPGSDHGKRKHRISNKILFDSEKVYDATDLSTRWGENSSDISSLCDNIRKIPQKSRRGFGNAMSNTIFYHSVPNNIPGMLYLTKKNKWTPLFKGRSFPPWLDTLFQIYNPSQKSYKYPQIIPEEVYFLLLNAKKGIRTKRGLARSMDCDIKKVTELIELCIYYGLLSDKKRLTDSGYKHILEHDKVHKSKQYPDYSLYVPKSWRVDQG